MKTAVKVFCVLCILALVFGAVACNSPKPPTQSPTQKPNDEIPNALHDFGGRTFRVTHGLIYETNAWKTDSPTDVRMRSRIKWLRDKCNGNITLVCDGANYENYIIPSMIAGNPVTDLTDIVPFSVHRFINGNCITPINDYAGITDMDNPDLWDQETQNAFTFKGQRYGLVMRHSMGSVVGVTKVLFFNQTLLTESNVTDDLYKLQENKQWTWDKFAEISMKVTKDSDGDGKTDIWGAGGNGYSLLSGFVMANDGQLFGNNTEGIPDVLFDKKPAREAFEFLVDLSVNKKAMRQRPVEEGGAIDVPMFVKGQIGFTAEYCNRIIPGVGNIGKMKDDFGILFFPLAPNKTEYKLPMDYYEGWALVRNAEDPAKIMEFASFMFRPVLTEEQSEADFEMEYTENVRDSRSMDTLKSITWDNIVLNQAGAYVVGGTDYDATFLIIDGTELAFLGEETVQTYYDTWMPVLKERMQKCWSKIMD